MLKIIQVTSLPRLLPFAPVIIGKRSKHEKLKWQSNDNTSHENYKLDLTHAVDK
jgi:hypothetical protein